MIEEFYWRTGDELEFIRTRLAGSEASRKPTPVEQYKFLSDYLTASAKRKVWCRDKSFVEPTSVDGEWTDRHIRCITEIDKEIVLAFVHNEMRRLAKRKEPK